MRRKSYNVVAAIILVGLLAAGIYFHLARRDESVWPKGRVTADSGYREVMGTFARVMAVCMDNGTADRCIRSGFEQLELVDDLMSEYKVDSELSKVNREAHKQAVRVSEPLFKVLQRSVQFSRSTNGAFDVTVGPAVHLWREAGKRNSAPSKDELAETRMKIGSEKLILDEQNKTVRFAASGMRLDLGGIAKGYAVDLAIEAMQRAGAIGGMVDAGGNIRCFGAPPRGKEKWKVALQDPKNVNEDVLGGGYLLVLELVDEAVATSGDYRRFVLIEGKRYSHIVNPATSTSAQGLCSVTIISKNATDADALATAVSVMGREKGLALVESLADTEAILISSAPNFERTQSAGAKKYIRQ